MHTTFATHLCRQFSVHVHLHSNCRYAVLDDVNGDAQTLLAMLIAETQQAAAFRSSPRVPVGADSVMSGSWCTPTSRLLLSPLLFLLMLLLWCWFFCLHAVL